MRRLLRLSCAVFLAIHLLGCAGAYRAEVNPDPGPDSRDSKALIATGLIVGFFIGTMLIWRAIEKD